MSMSYLMLEIRRVLRSPRFMIMTIALPIVLFILYVGIFVSGGPPGQNAGATQSLMVSMTAFGAMAAALFTGTRVAIERQAGWQRQLRLTPLSGGGYLATKVLVGMAMALAPALCVPVVGAIAEGVSLDAFGWLRVTLGVWLAVIPFALIGLYIGQVGTADSTQPITQLVMLPMALIGGIFIPLDVMPSWLHGVAQVLPSYWLADVGRGAIPGASTTSLGMDILVLGCWVVVLGGLVIRRYRRDSARV